MDSTSTKPVDSLLTLEKMSKSFATIKANDNVSLRLAEGEIHALLGENGAGKSTLVKMIYGILKPDSGKMTWRGQPITINSPATARNLGIAMVFQHFSLFESMSTLENIALGMGSGIQLDQLRQDVIDVSERYGLPLDPDRHVYTLSVGERQRIEVIRCLLQNPRLLIMDEPTSVLTPQEANGLFETLRQLANEGMAVLYISHKLNEIKSLCENATILRGGKVVDCVKVSTETIQSLATKMMDEELTTMEGATTVTPGEVRLQLSNLTQPAHDQFNISLNDISIAVHAGEIVGIAGVAGNGQDELLQAINGETLTQPSDSVRINNQSCAHLTPNQRRLLGLASVPEKRLGHAAVPDMSLVDNTLLTAFQRLRLVAGGLIKFTQCRAICEQIVSLFKVKTLTVHTHAGSLSGGNLQKFIVGREIIQQPTVLVVSQPTWGVDAGSAQAIHRALKQLAEKGSAILVISQDSDELMAICNRIAAICGGRLSDSIKTEQATMQKIGLLMSGAPLSDSD